MSDLTPPPESGPKSPRDYPQRDYSVTDPPSKKACTAIGVGVFILTSLMSIVALPSFLLGLAIAIGSLFFAGYRFICLGYFLGVGLLFLSIVIYCSAHPLRL